MSTVGLALSSLLTLAPATVFALAPPAETDPANGAETGPAAGAETPVSAPAPAWGPEADVAVSQMGPAPRPWQPAAPAPAAYAPPPRPMMGVGLMVSSAVVFTVGLTARVHQVDVAVAQCRRGGWVDDGFANRTECFDFHDSPRTDSNDLFVGAAYGSSMVLTMIGSGALGEHSAWQSVYGDGRARRPTPRYVVGALLVGLGASAIGAHYGLVYANAQAPCTSWECNVQRRALWIAASDGGAALLNAGFGILSWAGNYRGSVDRYSRIRWSVTPGVSRGSVGATAVVRF